MPAQTKAQRFLKVAREAFDRSSDWTEFSNAVYGAGSPFAQLFPTRKQREAFSRTEEAREIKAMMEKLPDAAAAGELVLRLPASMREALQREADKAGVGLLALCLAKLSTPLGQSVTFL